jgi:GAF domain-containing protein
MSSGRFSWPEHNLTASPKTGPKARLPQCARPPTHEGSTELSAKGHNGEAMESRPSGQGPDQSSHEATHAAAGDAAKGGSSLSRELLDSEAEVAARQRLFDEVLASVELVLIADGAAFWREEADHTLVLTASRSIPQRVLEALDCHVTTPLQSIMQRWPESPMVAVPLNDLANPIAEEIRSVTQAEGIVGIAGVPCRIPGEMLGMLIVIHRRPHPWTVRDLGLAAGLAGQLATAMQNAHLYASVRSLANRLMQSTN